MAIISGVAMNRIAAKTVLNPSFKLIRVEAPLIARKQRPGQFVMLRVHPDGERIPLTIADADPAEGTVTLIFQEVGKTTLQLGLLEAGDHVQDLAGPFGVPADIRLYGTVAVVGGGAGIAVSYPEAKALKKAGNRVLAIIGARSRDLLILEEEMAAVSDKLYVATDDGSRGRRGTVTDVLSDVIEKGARVDVVIAAGPVPMMKAVAEMTRPRGIRTLASLNPIMIDATGMCGGCRVSVGGETKFACVDGPEFDAHQVDFDLLLARQRVYLEKEKEALKRWETVCRLPRR